MANQNNTHKQDKFILLVTGEAGVGKSYISNKLEHIAKKQNIKLTNIEFDYIGHEILGSLTSSYYKSIRKKLISVFSEQILNKNEKENLFINRKILSKIVFNDNDKLKTLNKIMRRPILKRLDEILENKTGIILINGALVAEFKLSYLSNNNVLVIKTSKKIQNERLKQRNLSSQMIKKILLSQLCVDDKIKAIEKQIKKDKCGKIIIFNNENAKNKNIEELLSNITNTYKIKNKSLTL